MAASYPLLLRLGAILKPLPFYINIQGHTDNIPIGSSEYPSNWELSGMRALAVGRFLIENVAFPGPALDHGLQRVPAGGAQHHAGQPRAEPTGRDHIRYQGGAGMGTGGFYRALDEGGIRVQGRKPPAPKPPVSEGEAGAEGSVQAPTQQPAQPPDAPLLHPTSPDPRPTLHVHPRRPSQTCR